MYRLISATNENSRANDPRGASYKEYRQIKQAHLDAQLAAGMQFETFKDQVIMLNGRLEPSASYLRQLIGLHGGRVVFQWNSSVTVVVCENLSTSKFLTFSKKKCPLVLPSWILACAEAGKLLDTSAYVLIQNEESNAIREQPQGDFITLPKNPFHSVVQDPHDAVLQAAVAQFMSSKELICQEISRVLPASVEVLQAAKAAQARLQKSQSPQTPLEYIFAPQAPVEKPDSAYQKNARLPLVGQWVVDAQEYLMGHCPIDSKAAKEPFCYLQINVPRFLLQAAIRQVPAVQQHTLQSRPSCVIGIQMQEQIIAECNETARKLGVCINQTLEEAIVKCPGLVVLPFDRAAFSDVLRRFLQALLNISTQIQPNGCAECCICVPVEAVEGAKTIQHNLLEHTGLQSAIGIGNTVTQARMAALLAAPAGVVSIQSKEQFQELTRHVSVADCPLISNQIAQRLLEAGVQTLGDLQMADPDALRRGLGDQQGFRLKKAALGEDYLPFKPTRGYTAEKPARNAGVFSASVSVATEASFAEALRRVISQATDQLGQGEVLRIVCHLRAKLGRSTIVFECSTALEHDVIFEQALQDLRSRVNLCEVRSVSATLRQRDVPTKGFEHFWGHFLELEQPDPSSDVVQVKDENAAVAQITDPRCREEFLRLLGAQLLARRNLQKYVNLPDFPEKTEWLQDAL